MCRVLKEKKPETPGVAPTLAHLSEPAREIPSGAETPQSSDGGPPYFGCLPQLHLQLDLEKLPSAPVAD